LGLSWFLVLVLVCQDVLGRVQEAGYWMVCIEILMCGNWGFWFGDVFAGFFLNLGGGVEGCGWGELFWGWLVLCGYGLWGVLW
jgi:hypothetical protein